MGITGLIVSALATYWYLRSAIHLSDEEIIITSPAGTKRVKFADLRRMEIDGDTIVLDEGKIPRILIYLTSRDSGVLVASIERRILAARKKNESH